MQQKPTDISRQHLPSLGLPSATSARQNGFIDSSGAGGCQQLASDSGVSVSNEPSSAQAQRHAAGQRIIDYENALATLRPNAFSGEGVSKRRQGVPGGAELTDLPNELLTYIISLVPPDSFGSISLVSRRFHALVTTSHAWRTAFLRYFPGQTTIPVPAQNSALHIRPFARLTLRATWRSEYLLRTRLMSILGRARPGSIKVTSIRQKKNAVLTYNSKLPWRITNLHAVYSHGKQPLRAIHGVADLGVASMSDPHNAKVETWGGFDNIFGDDHFSQLAASTRNYGLTDGPASTPNTMDVSQCFGFVFGQGFPGGCAYFTPVNEARGRFLVSKNPLLDAAHADIPMIPRTIDAISSVWISKSPVPSSVAQSMCGIMTGSTLGVVTAYSLGFKSDELDYGSGDVTARWALCPGVPIISIKLDHHHSAKRQSAARLWAVALNALGEVFYLTESPRPAPKDHDATVRAWATGRSVCWHLVDGTRRTMHGPELSSNTNPQAPRRLDAPKLVADAREIERLMNLQPAHFRSLYKGWDMQRRLEVDFAADDDNGAGEAIFVIDCGIAQDQPAAIRRFTRALVNTQPQSGQGVISPAMPTAHTSPLFAPIETDHDGNFAPGQTLPSTDTWLDAKRDHWRCSMLHFMSHSHCIISASAMDCSCYSQLTLAEDELCAAGPGLPTAAPSWSARADGAWDLAVPGHRARFIAAGTQTGVVLVWNGRDANPHGIYPVRMIQTASPSISCLAISALYLVHGGCDGLVQAWDHLASSQEAMRTINPRSEGRVPRHVASMNPALRNANFSSVDAISLDPDPTAMRGVLSFGNLLRYWNYSPTVPPLNHKRRTRSSIDGHTENRRLSRAVSGHIAAEEAEVRRENQRRARDRARLHQRFGFGTSVDLTEHEATVYAQMMSQESFLREKQRSTGYAAINAGPNEAAPDGGSLDASHSRHFESRDDESEFEHQLQQAIRLSLLETSSSLDQPQHEGNSGSTELETPTACSTPSDSAKAAQASLSGAISHEPRLDSRVNSFPPFEQAMSEDEHLALALSLSLRDQGADSSLQPLSANDFPPLQGDKHNG